MSSSLTIPSSTMSSTMSSTLFSPSAISTCPTYTVSQIPIKTGPYCGVAVQIGSNDETANATRAMQACCHDAPIISFSNSCDIYCNAVGQSIEQLSSCLSLNFGADKGNTAGILCSSSAAAAATTVRPHIVAKAMILAVMLWRIGSLADSL